MQTIYKGYTLVTAENSSKVVIKETADEFDSTTSDWYTPTQQAQRFIDSGQVEFSE